jgi:hypothetical protein
VLTPETSATAQPTSQSVLLMENAFLMPWLMVFALPYSSVNAHPEHHSSVLMDSAESLVLSAQPLQAAQWDTTCAQIKAVSEIAPTPLIPRASNSNAKPSLNVHLACTNVKIKIVLRILSNAQPENLVTTSTTFFAQITPVSKPNWIVLHRSNVQRTKWRVLTNLVSSIRSMSARSSRQLKSVPLDKSMRSKSKRD